MATKKTGSQFKRPSKAAPSAVDENAAIDPVEGAEGNDSSEAIILPGPDGESGKLPEAEPQAETATADSAPENDTEVSQADAVSQPDEAPAPAKSGRSAGFLALLAGGAIAAGIGYGVALWTMPAPPPDPSAKMQAMQVEIDQLRQQLGQLTQKAAAADPVQLKAELSDLKTAIDSKTAQLQTRLASTQKQLESAVAALAAERKRMADALESTGGKLSGTAGEMVARYGAEIEALKAQISAQMKANTDLSSRLDSVAKAATEQLQAAQQKAADMANSAVSTVKNADVSMAVTRLQAALDTGRSYAALLVEIARDAAVSVPPALQEPAVQGVTPLLRLQQDFPEAARAGLKASIRADAGPGIADKLIAFVKAQIGARSLEPLPGDSPDALLSRAQAALSNGDLAAAVELVRKLPKEGQQAMAPWLEAAETRLAAYNALKEFSKTLKPQN